ncbi:MAG TPA: Ig-like domain-containing protein [Solirubrobacteraceae bacterium]
MGRNSTDAGARRGQLVGRRMMRLAVLTAALALAFAASGTAAPPFAGTLTPMTGTAGCEMVVGGSLDCTEARGIGGAESVTVSPDGRNVYVTSYPLSSPSAPNGLAVFSRSTTTGALTQLPGTSGCMTPAGDSAAGPGTCTAVPELGNGDGHDFVISPDGKFAYVAGANPDAIVLFSRDAATGALTQLPGTAACITVDGSSPAGANTCQAMPNLAGPFHATMSPDGHFLYVIDFESATDGIVVFARDSATGALSEVQCVFDAPAPTGCDTARDVGGSQDIVISPDGLHAFSNVSDGISSLARDPSTGFLTQPAGAAGCISDDGTDDEGNPTCGTGRFLDGLYSMAISPDGHMLYATAGDGLGNGGVVFLRVAADGSLSQPNDPPCTSNTGNNGSCESGLGLESPQGITMSPDGRQVYITSQAGDDGDALDTYAIVAADGSVGGGDCITVDGGSDALTGACATGGPGFEFPYPAAISPDGESLYLPSFANGAVLGFHRETAPVCQPATASTTFMRPVTITLSCSDPDGDTVKNWAISRDPAHGVVNPVNQATHTVQYFPGFLFSGVDSFTFTVNDGQNTSAPQTATITVGPPPPPPAPAPTPRLSHVRQSHHRWREAGKAERHAPPVGTTFSFTLNTKAKVTFTFTQRLPGRTVGDRCVAPSRGNAKHRACSRTRARGSFSFTKEAGVIRRDFSGSVPHHGRLPTGSYTVTLTAKHIALHSAPTTLRFTIVS